jgi:KDO2-lipid IV(A) lauroyltransferase
MRLWPDGFMRLLCTMPLAGLRALGVLLGWFLHAVVTERRHVVMTNLRLCFPDWDEGRRRRVGRAVFVYFAQAWLDRAWLWHADPAVLRRRLRLSDPQGLLAQEGPTVFFAPHFVGLDAGWTRLAMEPGHRMSTIYTPQSSPGVDAWVKAGRARLGQVALLRREDGVKRIVKALREGERLYLLPDMNFGTEESVFVPFYGISAATVPSLSRFAALGRARVVPVVTFMTDQGYEVRVLPAWTDFPTADAVADTCTMNQRLQAWIDAEPAQYFWVHQRFKSRPPGEPSVYD